METSFCSVCNKQFKSGGSYRIHKYRYHRPKPAIERPIEEVQTEEPVERPIEENRTESEDDSSGELTESTEESSDSGLGLALGIGGTILAIILFLFFGRKGGDNL